MKRLLNIVKSILKFVLGGVLYVLIHVLAFIMYMIYETPLGLSIPMCIGCIGTSILCVLKASAIDWQICSLLIVGIIFLISIIYNIYYKIFTKRKFNCLTRLRKNLTDEFQEVQIKNTCRKKDLVNIVVEKSPYVFKARMKLDTIEYQFETKEGEVFYSEETTDYLWFEKNVHL